MRAKPRIRRNRVKRDPFTTEKRTPMEILSRLAGRTNFITPKQGGSSSFPVTDLDVAAAIASAKDKLGSTMAMAIACQRPQEWPKVEERGLPRLMSDLRAQRQRPGIVAGPYKFRARIALYESFQELLYPTRREPLSVAAKRVGIRATTYWFLLKRALALLNNAADNAASEATKFLFRQIATDYVAERGLPQGATVFIEIDDDGEFHVHVPDDAKELAS